jgi:hypothetical protein
MSIKASFIESAVCQSQSSCFPASLPTSPFQYWYLRPQRLHTVAAEWQGNASLWFKWKNRSEKFSIHIGESVSIQCEVYRVPERMVWMVRGTSVHREWFVVPACLWVVLGTNVHGECYMVPACNLWYLVPAYTWMVHATSLHCKWHMVRERMVCMCMVPL